MPLPIDKVMYILTGPDPTNWSVLMQDERGSDSLVAQFMCRTRLEGRGYSDQVRFQSVQATRIPESSGWHFQATGVRWPAESLELGTHAVGSFDPTTDERVKGLLVAVTRPLQQSEIGAFIARWAEPAST